MNKLIIALALAVSATFASEDRAPEVALASFARPSVVRALPEIRLVASQDSVILKQVASVKPPQQIGTCYKVSEAGGCWSE